MASSRVFRPAGPVSPKGLRVTCAALYGASCVRLLFRLSAAILVAFLLLLGYQQLFRTCPRPIVSPSATPTVGMSTRNITERVVEKIVVKEVKVQMYKMPGLLSLSEANMFDAMKPVPRIVHFTWSGNKIRLFGFHNLVSVIGALKYIKPERVMFWYERMPEGPYWAEAKSRINKTSRLNLKFRKGPESIYGNSIKVPEHQADVIRLEALLLYGGIYMDLDVLVLRPLDSLMVYDTTMGYEMADSLCNGFIMSKPFAPFLKLWHMEYLTFDDKQWNYHSVQLPARLAQSYPALVHTEWDTIHRPNWQELDKIYKEGHLYDWSKNYAMHLWYRFYDKDHNPDNIKNLNSTLGEMFRYIYYGRKEIIT